MKKILYISAAFFAMSFLTTSCDDRMDYEQEMSTGSSIDYSSPELAKGALIGAYTKFQDVGWEQIPLISVRGDDVNAGGLGDQQPFADTDNFFYDNNYWMFNSLWEAWYQDILQYNVQIAQLEKFREGGVSGSLIDQYIAEVKVLRAFQLMEISKIWGTVIFAPTDDQADYSMKTKEEIMTWISEQMDEAIPLLPDMRPNQRTDVPGGITKYTGLAVKAMANQENENYSAVAEAAGQIINSGKFTLYSSFYELFKIPGKLADENLLEIQYSDLGNGSGTNYSHLYGFYGPTSWTPQVTGAGAGWGFYEPSMKWIKFMLSRGEKERLQTSVLFTNRGITEIKKDPSFATLPSWITNTTPDGDVVNDYPRAMFASGKHYLPSNQLTPGRTDYGTNKNYIVMRYAEILLMYAEAVSRGGTASAGTALNAVNTVRGRAGMSALTSVTSDQIMDEKNAELGMEWGIRYYDMVRLGNTSALSYDGRTFSMDKRFLPYPLAQLTKINSLGN